MWAAQAISGLGGGAVMSATLGLVSAAADHREDDRENAGR
jgi:hypothetical protein